MLDESQRRFDGIHFKTADAEKLPFPDAWFDVVRFRPSTWRS